MATEASGDNVMLGRGKVYFDRLNDSGVGVGERFLGNCTTFEISTSDELREKYSSAEQSAPLLKRVNVRRTQEINITLDEFTKENLALALMGDNSALAQGSGSVSTAEVFTVQTGMWYKLEFRNVDTGTVVVKDATETTTYDITDDYLVDLVTGRIYIVPTGDISDDDVIHVTAYDYSADTTVTVRSGVDNLIEGLVRFIGDPAAGPVFEVEVWKVSMTPEGALGFIGDDFAEFTLKGSVLAMAEAHPNEPYFRVMKRT